MRSGWIFVAHRFITYQQLTRWHAEWINVDKRMLDGVRTVVTPPWS